MLSEEFNTRPEAMIRKKFLKSGKRREWLKTCSVVELVRLRRINRKIVGSPPRAGYTGSHLHPNLSLSQMFFVTIPNRS